MTKKVNIGMFFHKKNTYYERMMKMSHSDSVSEWVATTIFSKFDWVEYFKNIENGSTDVK
jgi:hypothetical protein